MKKIMAVVFAGLIAFALTATAEAAIKATRPLTLKANVKAATGVEIVVWKHVKGKVDNPEKEPSNDLNFELEWDPVNSIFLAKNYYGVYVTAVGGVGTTKIVLDYKEGAKPAGAKASLGDKAVVSVYEAYVDADKKDQEDRKWGKRLGDVRGVTVNTADFQKGWFHMYIGTATGDKKLDEAGAVPFGTSDAAGDYDGILTITATF